MALTTFTAPALFTANQVATVGITDPDVVSGVQNPANTNGGRMPIWGGPVNPAQRGGYLTASPGAILTFQLTKRSSGYLGQSRQSIMVLLYGDASNINGSASPLLSITATDAVFCTLVSCTFGTLTMAVVQ